MPLLVMPFLTAPAAIVCGHLARRKIKRAKGALYGGGLALAGLITGYVALPLECAVLVPAFGRVAVPSIKGMMRNDARQVASAAQQYLLEYQVESVAFVYSPTTGEVGEPLKPFVARIAKSYAPVPQRLTKGGTFQLGHPKVGVMTFDADGRLVEKQPAKP